MSAVMTKLAHLGEQRVETVHFLSLFDIGVVLGDTFQGELIHEVDVEGLDHVSILPVSLAGRGPTWSTHRKVLDDVRECCREEHDLSLLRTEGQQLFNDRSELLTQQLVRLVHDEHFTLSQVCDALASEVQDTTRGSDENVDRFLESHDVVSQCSASGRDHDLESFDV